MLISFDLGIEFSFHVKYYRGINDHMKVRLTCLTWLPLTQLNLACNLKRVSMASLPDHFAPSNQAIPVHSHM